MSILGGLAQGAFNYLAQKSANKTNIKLQKQANQANFDLYKEQVKDQEAWYNKYSSPLALRQQYEQAGYSPYAAGCGDSASSGNLFFRGTETACSGGHGYFRTETE